MCHIVQVGIRELRQSASAVLRRVAAGETIVVTDRGRPVARILPIAQGGAQALIDAGLVRMPPTRMSDAPEPLVLEATSLTASEALAELRADER